MLVTISAASSNRVLEHTQRKCQYTNNCFEPNEKKRSDQSYVLSTIQQSARLYKLVRGAYTNTPRRPRKGIGAIVDCSGNIYRNGILPMERVFTGRSFMPCPACTGISAAS